MGLRVIDQSTAPLIDLDVVKSHLRIDINDEDAYLTALAMTVIRQAQVITNRQIIPATLELTLDEFPFTERIYLPRPPSVAVESIQYRDQAGQYQTISESDYIIDPISAPARIVPRNGWPATSSDIMSVIITYQAGYEILPPDLAHQLLLCIGTYYQERELLGNERTKLIMQSLLADYRITDSRIGGFSL
jgi:uncharacterized phiE125 gp8 family phage protein